jgi:iron complex outermembrane receptor protein
MNALGKPLPASVPVRSGSGAAFWSCCIACLLFALPICAQEQTTEATAAAEAAIEASAGETEGTPNGAVESDAGALEEDHYSVEDLEGPIEPELPEGIEEIKVTSERGMGTPEDAPISTVGFDADVILKEGIKDIRDLSNFTPSLEIKSAFAVSNPTIFIRGVGLDDFNANAASAVAIYQDGVYMQSPAGQLFQFFDVEGVEVLRGPQGALYRNASAGAILVRSRKPTDEFETYATVTLGNYRHVELMSAISGPIVPDLISGRMAGTWGVREGTTENRCSYLAPDRSPCDKTIFGVPVVEPDIGGRTNDIDAYALRGHLLYKPRVLDLEWLLNAHGGQNFSRAFQYQHRGVAWELEFDPDDPDIRIPKPLEPPKFDARSYKDTDSDPFAGDYNIDGPEELDLWGINLKGNWRFGEAYEVESLTAYEWHDRYTLENTDASPNLMLETAYADTAWQFSQELNLRGEWAASALGDGTWVIGAFYLQEDLDVENFFDVFPGNDLTQTYSQKTRNFAAYAQSEYKIQPGCTTVSCDFTLITGLRYNVEYKEFDIFVCSGSAGCFSTLEGVEDDMWDGLSGEASLAWHFFEDNNVYLKYSRGWKGGHFNGGAVTPFDVITAVDPEIVDSYEAGLRSRWLDGRLMVNATGFYYDYQDLQVFQLEQTPAGFPIAKLENATDAVVYGVELDMAASPIDGLNLTLNASWVESEYTEFVVNLPYVHTPPASGQVPRPPITFRKEFDYSGNPLIASPRFSVTGSVDYEIRIPGRIGRPGLGSIIPRFSFSWKDDVFFDAGRGTGASLNFPEGTFGQEAFWVFNAALSWRSESERIEVTGWVHNFTDNHYKTQSFDLSRGFHLILDAYADPRTYGVTATISF